MTQEVGRDQVRVRAEIDGLDVARRQLEVVEAVQVTDLAAPVIVHVLAGEHAHHCAVADSRVGARVTPADGQMRRVAVASDRADFPLALLRAGHAGCQ